MFVLIAVILFSLHIYFMLSRASVVRRVKSWYEYDECNKQKHFLCAY
jgi:hypothetical protein